MDTSKFLELYEASSEVGDEFEATKGALGRILDASETHHYYDISGDGTQYYRYGALNGVGFSACVITLAPDGLVTVRAESVGVPEHLTASVSKLCRAWNTHFKLKGLKVEDGVMVFESAPFDPALGHFDADEAASLALSVVHHYASVVLALEAGVEPWNLLDFNDELDEGSEGDGGGDGHSVATLEELRKMVGSLSRTPGRKATCI